MPKAGDERPAEVWSAQPGQESVWDFPRPAVCEAEPQLLQACFGGMSVAETRAGYRTLETSLPPSYYFPMADVQMQYLQATEQTYQCEWKGRALFYDVIVGGSIAKKAAWSYIEPAEGFQALAGHVAFYPALMDGCFVGGERASPQQGGVYGGWITSRLAGPFKGGPGSEWW